MICAKNVSRMAYRGRGPQKAGFTLIELMVAVAIIGILASVAVPSFMRNARRAKLTEATVQLNRIFIASRSYILELHGAAGQAGNLPAQFPNSEPNTPAAACCTFAGNKCPPSATDWTTPTWQALMFEVQDPHYYQYAYLSTGDAAPGPGSNFMAEAFGDLNCDGTYSFISLYGIWSNIDYDVHGAGGFAYVNELE